MSKCRKIKHEGGDSHIKPNHGGVRPLLAPPASSCSSIHSCPANCCKHFIWGAGQGLSLAEKDASALARFHGRVVSQPRHVCMGNLKGTVLLSDIEQNKPTSSDWTLRHPSNIL